MFSHLLIFRSGRVGRWCWWWRLRLGRMHLSEGSPGDGGAQVGHGRLHGDELLEEKIPWRVTVVAAGYGGWTFPKAIRMMALRRSVMVHLDSEERVEKKDSHRHSRRDSRSFASVLDGSSWIRGYARIPTNVADDGRRWAKAPRRMLPKSGCAEISERQLPWWRRGGSRPGRVRHAISRVLYR